MTPKDFVTEPFGEGWKPSQLTSFLDAIKGWSEDSQRYYAVRDFAKKLEWRIDPQPLLFSHSLEFCTLPIKV
jgi:hypothetical protein